MIDYNATLQEFFKETQKYLEGLRKRATDEIFDTRITDAISIISRVAGDPKKYADYNARVNDGWESADFVEAFIPVGTSDNRVWLTYASVVNSMGELWSQYDWHRSEAQKKLLQALKTMKYRNSKNVLKDLVFPFRDPKSFAIQRGGKQK